MTSLVMGGAAGEDTDAQLARAAAEYFPNKHFAGEDFRGVHLEHGGWYISMGDDKGERCIGYASDLNGTGGRVGVRKCTL